MVSCGAVVLAFAMGSLDFLAFQLYRPRLRNAFQASPMMKLVFLSWTVLSGILAALIYCLILLVGSMVAVIEAPGGPGPWILAVIIPFAVHHLAMAWPARGRFAAPDQGNRVLYPYHWLWDLASGSIENRYSRQLEKLAGEYASVPWNERSLARIHARIVPRYRGKKTKQRVNPQLLASLKKFRTQQDVFTFFYTILEEFGPRSVNVILAKLVDAEANIER